MGPIEAYPSPARPIPPERADELRALLQATSVADGRAVVLHRDGIDAVIGIWPTEGMDECVDLVISAFMPGRGRWRLDGMNVYARGRVAGSDFVRCGEPIRRGDIAIRAVPLANGLSLHAPITMGSHPLPSRAQAQGSLRMDDRPRTSLAAAPFSPSPTRGLSNPFLLASNDERVRLTLRAAGPGRTVVAAETDEVSLCGSTVAFYFTDAASGRVTHEGEIMLRRVPGESTLCEGRAEGPMPCVEPCVFIFEVER